VSVTDWTGRWCMARIRWAGMCDIVSCRILLFLVIQ